jgi:hypothetical protein
MLKIGNTGVFLDTPQMPRPLTGASKYAPAGTVPALTVRVRQAELDDKRPFGHVPQMGPDGAGSDFK